MSAHQREETSFVKNIGQQHRDDQFLLLPRPQNFVAHPTALQGGGRHDDDHRIRIDDAFGNGDQPFIAAFQCAGVNPARMPGGAQIIHQPIGKRRIGVRVTEKHRGLAFITRRRDGLHRCRFDGWRQHDGLARLVGVGLAKGIGKLGEFVNLAVFVYAIKRARNAQQPRQRMFTLSQTAIIQQGLDAIDGKRIRRALPLNPI